MINLALREGIPSPDMPNFVSTAEAATLQLEFRYLSHLTNSSVYWEKVEKVHWHAVFVFLGLTASRLCKSSRPLDNLMG